MNPNPTGRLRKTSALVCLVLFALAACDRHNAASAQRDGRLLHQKLRYGQYKEVLDSSREHAVVWRDRPASDSYVTFRLLESEAFLALAGAEEAAAILKALQPPTEYLRVRRDVDLAEALFRLDDYDQAAATLQQILESVRDDQFPELRIHALNVEGQLFGKKSHPQESEQAYRTALHLAERIDDSYWRARVLNNLGFTRLVNERYDEALPYFEQALAAIEKEHTAYLASVFLSNAAICYKELGDIDRAFSLRMQALAMQQTLPASLGLMNSYGEIGRLYESRNDPRKAVEYYQRALAVAEERHIKSDAATWAVDLSLAYIELQDWANAERANSLAHKLDPKGAEDLDLYEDLSSAATAAARGDLAAARQRYEQVAQAPSENVRTKWTAYDELGKLYAAGDRVQANRCFERAIALITQSRALLSKDDHKITFLSQPIQIYQDYVEALIAQQEDAQAMLVADSSRAQTMLGEAQANTSVRELQHIAAASNSILLSYWLTPNRCFVWRVTGKGIERVLIPGTEASIRELVNAYRQEILDSPRDPLANPNSAGWKLSDAILAPLEQSIPAGSHVIAVLDGALHDIPLETIPVSRAHPQFWLERVTFSVAPSLASLASKAGVTERATGGILAVGDTQPAGKYPRLPQARAEIESLDNRFPHLRKTVLTGADANVESYRAEQPERFSLIHFAAHAEANSTVPLDSAIILSPRNGAYKLYARDVANPAKPLRADLITISGCTSAGSKSYRGEGLIGLEWAFLHAGARNVVAGLWEADDVSTARLMNRFYAALEAGKKPAEALRAAKLELLQSGRTPYYWGPFQVYRRSP